MVVVTNGVGGDRGAGGTEGGGGTSACAGGVGVRSLRGEVVRHVSDAGIVL